ncbi:MAG: MlaD family protein [Propionibacteriales bacterium]|nr:MlaD family protein [Propionibacteriales bacterium]
MTRRWHLRRSVAVTLIVALGCVLGFVYLWSRAGGGLPAGDDYRVSFLASDIKNLQDGGDVRVAGVRVGKVVSREVEGEQVRVALELDASVAPLHGGVTVRIGLKSLIGQSMVVVEDGDGEAIEDGAALSAESVVPAVDIDEVVTTFDPATRASLASALTRVGAVTDGTEESVQQARDGLGRIGREGFTATDALAAQSADLADLVRHTTTLLASLNTRRTALTSLIDSSEKITTTLAERKDNLARTVRSLPELLAAAEGAGVALGDLSDDLRPVAADLEASAANLRVALRQLPPVTRDLRAVMPVALSALRRADGTLAELPGLAGNLTDVSPALDILLRNVNPVLGYVQPYAYDIGSFFGNFGGSFDFPVENGVRPARLAAIFSQDSLRGSPLKLPELNPLHYANPYPTPGGAGRLDPFGGTYPRVERDR